MATTDEQITELMSAAQGLLRRYGSAGGTPERAERLLRLDWAVREGRFVLARRHAELRRDTALCAPSRRAGR